MHTERELPHPLLEVLFTSEWSALYDPVTRSRWDTSGLFHEPVFDALNGKDGVDADTAGCLREACLDTPAISDREAIREWCEAGWSDPLRHYLHTNRLPKLNYADASGWIEDFTTMREKVGEEEVPPLTKEYTRAVSPIEIPLAGMPLPAREERLTLSGLAHLLVHAFGISGEKRLAVTGRHVRRTSPSGGSRHPTEAYAVAFDVDGLAPGVYHFNSVRRSLALVHKGQFQAQYLCEVAGLNRRISFAPRAALVLTSVVERSMHRYRDPRSYRVLHFDLGHLLKTLQLLARDRGMRYFSAYSLGDSAAERMLGVDGLMETAMCQFLLG